ncbi:hypothetical protein TNCV_1310481 [Trichonephila clavipes]|nr:hypothetical protein TNCV_1310481 [Trichonephila clavipes]
MPQHLPPGGASTDGAETASFSGKMCTPPHVSLITPGHAPYVCNHPFRTRGLLLSEKAAATRHMSHLNGERQALQPNRRVALAYI